MPVLTPEPADEQAIRDGLRTDAPMLVACLCAAWCGSCREFEESFEALSERHPETIFVWIDVEDYSDLVDGIDVENFPTIVIQYGSEVRFTGALPPRIAQIERLIRELGQGATGAVPVAIDLRARLLAG